MRGHCTTRVWQIWFGIALVLDHPGDRASGVVAGTPSNLNIPRDKQAPHRHAFHRKQPCGTSQLYSRARSIIFSTADARLAAFLCSSPRRGTPRRCTHIFPSWYLPLLSHRRHRGRTGGASATADRAPGGPSVLTRPLAFRCLHNRPGLSPPSGRRQARRRWPGGERVRLMQLPRSQFVVAAFSFAQTGLADGTAVRQPADVLPPRPPTPVLPTR